MSGFILIASAFVILGLGFWAVIHGGAKTEAEQAPSPDNDVKAIQNGRCPNCGAKGSLLAGPSGGMSQNAACNECLMEFNIHHGFGGLLGVDRTGLMDMSRASVFGISPEEYTSIPASGWKEVK